jgi:alkylation response protein AidB-like acyl-CoA dehydrogenase
MQAVSHRLVNCAIKIANMREMVYTAAKLWDAGRYNEAVRYASMTKIYATEANTEILQDCTILHGGVGFTLQGGIGRSWIASIGVQIAEQPPDVHRDVVAKTFGIVEGWKNGGMNGAL